MVGVDVEMSSWRNVQGYLEALAWPCSLDKTANWESAKQVWSALVWSGFRPRRTRRNKVGVTEGSKKAHIVGDWAEKAKGKGTVRARTGKWQGGH